MPPKRRAFQRHLGERRYRKLFVVAAEGVKTELHYFAIFNGQQSVIMVKCLKGRNDSAPRHVLKRMYSWSQIPSHRDVWHGTGHQCLFSTHCIFYAVFFSKIHPPEDMEVFPDQRMQP